MTTTKILLGVRFAAVLVGALSDAVRFAVDDWLDVGVTADEGRPFAAKQDLYVAHRAPRAGDDIGFDDHAPS